MKKAFTLFAVMCLAMMQTAFSQNITLVFSGETSDGDYVQLDSVCVQNVTRSWSETVSYPDTVLSFTQTGIADAQNLAADITSYPNPFNGATNVSIALPQSCEALMQVYNLAGQKVAERTMPLEAGNNLFEVSLQNPQVYLLAVTTPQGRSTIKLLNRGTGSGNSISYRRNGNIVEKRHSANPFHSGDMMKITGYATLSGSAATSNVIQQSLTGSENFTLIFPVISRTPPTVSTTTASSITDTSAVSGGNVTSDGGAAVTARGVCWSTSHNPTISDSHTTDGTGTGSFTSNITGLTAATTYYVRAYATNSVGTAYGNEITVTTMATLPTVTTTTASGITDTSAVSGGNVTNDGGAAVTARGVCWSTSHNPTTSDTHTNDSTGTGSFTSNITGLTAVTTYYVRAYATNSVGTAYGNEITVTTLANLPTVTTTTASSISDTSAVSGGNVISTGGAAVTARGVCWDTLPNPTINSSHTTNGSGTGSFSSNMTGLIPGTTYYVRAYATNVAGTAYGNQDTLTTRYILHGTIEGFFAVSANTRVYFSPGNLQWSATGGGSVATTHTVVGGTGEGTWRFAPNQWDTIGSDNTNISSTFTRWADLFRWATSGWHYPSDAYNTNYKPYSKGVMVVNESYNYYGYGPSSNMSTRNLVGTSSKYDWGVFNAIYNPKTTTTDMPGTWRTLTQSEWSYLLRTRNTPSGQLYAKATVNGVPGLIILPDNWIPAIHTFDSVNYSDASFAANIITLVQWDTLENAGAAFLPAAGKCTRTNYEKESSGYWSTTFYFQSQSHYLYLNARGFNTYSSCQAYEGHSVRLVRDTTTPMLPTVTLDSFRNITDTSVVCDSRVTNDGGAIVYSAGVCWSTSHNPTINDSHTSNGYETGRLSSNMRGLNLGTKYYVRAYASNTAGTAYSSEDSVTTLATPSGALAGQFSVSANRQVFFAKGNLQWSAKNGGSYATTHATTNGTAAGTWRFAPNQWDTIGAPNHLASSSYSGWIDLFGWGTSGWNNGNYFYQPYSTSNSTTAPYDRNHGFGYGPTDGTSYTFSLTDSFSYADWGIYNAISNGGNKPGMWRTLTKDEWLYLINTRATASGIRFAKATVNGITGLIVVPDNWDTNTYSLDSANFSASRFSSNVISSSNWNTLENAGCLFLPLSGYRNGTTVTGTGRYGNYWASTPSLSLGSAYNLAITVNGVNYSGVSRCNGNPVRLVRDCGAVPPTVSTSVASNITDTSVVSGGNVTNDGGTVVYARGVCWDTLPNPTINNSHSNNGPGTGSFTSNIIGLTHGTTYYIRAYAINASGISYGNEDTVTTAVYYAFSVSASDSVVFAPGNLQWSAKAGGSSLTTHLTADSTAEGTWRFAPNQWTTIGTRNNLIGSVCTGWIDLFGWMTSGYNNKDPYEISQTASDYGNGDNNISGTYYDWGLYNAIYNPKSNSTDAPGTWRTLTKYEMNYLLFTRSTPSGIRFAKAVVNNVNGVIIVPDNWDTATYTFDYPNTGGTAYLTNTINLTTWNELEKAGCVFLPVTGYRLERGISNTTIEGYYWTSTYESNNRNYAWALTFTNMGLSLRAPERFLGHSVRLVRDF